MIDHLINRRSQINQHGERLLRVISGKAKGRRLLSVKGMTTRPTSDNIKESIFNILPGEFEGKEVLDLFGGIGNLGIEALSRGAKKTVFIEINPRASSVIKRNLRNCGFIEKAQVIGTTVPKGIKILEKRGDRFDLIFLDPPYGKGMFQKTLVRISQSNVLKDNTLIIAEHSLSETLDGSIERLTLTDQRRYGTTLISFFEID